MVSTAYALPLSGMSGNNISLPGSEEQLFNVADQYWVGNGYLELMEIPVIEGRSFTENVAVSYEIMVNRAFVEKIQMYANWPDGPIGKQIFITGHDQGENVIGSALWLAWMIALRSCFTVVLLYRSNWLSSTL